MSHVPGWVDLPATKVDVDPLPPGTDATEGVVAADVNAIMSDLEALNTAVLAVPTVVTAGNNNQPAIGPFSTVSNDGDHTAVCYSPATNEWGQIVGTLVAINSDNSMATHTAGAAYRRVAGTLTVIQQGEILGPFGNHTYRFDFVASGNDIAVKYTGVGLQTITWHWGPFTVTKF